MKILHIIQRPQLRGAEIFASQIGTRHHAQGHQVMFVALFAHPNQPQLVLDGPALKVLELAENRRFIDREGWQRLAKCIREFQPDIVQANAADTLKYAVFSRLVFGWPGKLVYRNANKTSDFIKSLPKKWYNKWLVHQVDYVASVSRNCEVDFQELFSFPKEKTATLTIGTPIPASDSLPSAIKIRSELGIPADEPLLINIGSLVPEKNQTGLVDIFAAIYQEIKRGYLLLVGDGRMRAEVEERIQKLGLQERILLLGFRKDAVDLLSACDLMLMPSFIEGMPGVILEAMARRIPVIASEVGGINEIIINGQSGFLGDPTQPNTFVQPALALLADEKQKEKIAERAYEFVCNTKSIEVIADEFMEHYQQILQL